MSVCVSNCYLLYFIVIIVCIIGIGSFHVSDFQKAYTIKKRRKGRMRKNCISVDKNDDNDDYTKAAHKNGIEVEI